MKKKILNRIRRRDKKISRKKYGMRVDNSARTLADLKRRRLERLYGVAVAVPIKKKKKRLGERRKFKRVDDMGIHIKREPERRVVWEKTVWPTAVTSVPVISTPVEQPKSIPNPKSTPSYAEEQLEYLEWKKKEEPKEHPLQKLVTEGKMHQEDLDEYLKRQ